MVYPVSTKDRFDIEREEITDIRDFVLELSRLQALFDNWPKLVEKEKNNLRRIAELAEVEHKDKIQRIKDKQKARQLKLERMRIENRILERRIGYLKKKFSF